MKTKIFFSAIFLIAMILGGCDKSSDVLQEDDYSTLKKNLKERPFRITGNSVFTFFGGECDPDNNGTSAGYMGEGNAKHMGRVTYTGINCLIGENYENLNSEITVIAANGDELYLVSTDYAIQITGGEYPIFTYEGPGIIDDGTGRFSGATGSLDWIVVVNFAEGTATMEAEGTITY